MAWANAFDGLHLYLIVIAHLVNAHFLRKGRLWSTFIDAQLTEIRNAARNSYKTKVFIEMWALTAKSKDKSFFKLYVPIVVFKAAVSLPLNFLESKKEPGQLKSLGTDAFVAF
tara:strand:+ start:555 stop:893 length:339 start_codon:yes stop_codon:yes gene_type:complete